MCVSEREDLVSQDQEVSEEMEREREREREKKHPRLSGEGLRARQGYFLSPAALIIHVA